MLSQKLHDAINAQINAELWSAYLYLSMSMNFAAQGRNGIANWFKVQFQEEQAHLQRMQMSGTKHRILFGFQKPPLKKRKKISLFQK